MKILKWLLIATVLLCGTPLFAQGHSTSLAWTNSTDTANSLVFRLSGACPATVAGGTQLTATPVTSGAYVDSSTSLTAGSVFSYYVQATLNGTNSAPSNCVSLTIPVAPPKNLTISSVALVTNPDGTQTATAVWNDPNLGVMQTFSFSDGNQVKNQGLTSSGTGNFAEVFTAPAGTAVYFSVCNAAGQCASRQAM